MLSKVLLFGLYPGVIGSLDIVMISPMMTFLCKNFVDSGLHS